MFSVITNHIQQALSRLLTQYKNSLKLQNLLSAIITPIQTLEYNFNDLNTLRSISNAFGQQLDNIGKIVGLTRPPGMSDAQYQLELLGQIKVNTSQGQPEQAIQTWLLFTQTFQVRLFEQFPAEVLIESPYLPPDQTTANTLFNLLGEVLPAGVRANGIVAYDSVKPFAYRSVMAPGSGYGTVSDSTVGGKYGQLFRPFSPFGYGVNNPNIKGYGTRLDPLVGGAYAS